MLTGQLIFRDAAMRAPDGRKLMMVVGVVAVDESTNLGNDTRYVVTNDNDALGLSLDVQMPGEDLSQDTRVAMADAGKLLLMPIWRV